MKKILTVIIILIMLSSLVFAKLSDEVLREVEKLRWKHYGNVSLNCTDETLIYNGNIEWNRDFLNIWVEDGKLFIETQDGKWFIEMEKVFKEEEE